MWFYYLLYIYEFYILAAAVIETPSTVSQAVPYRCLDSFIERLC